MEGWRERLQRKTYTAAKGPIKCNSTHVKQTQLCNKVLHKKGNWTVLLESFDVWLFGPPTVPKAIYCLWKQKLLEKQSYKLNFFETPHPTLRIVKLNGLCENMWGMWKILTWTWQYIPKYMTHWNSVFQWHTAVRFDFFLRNNEVKTGICKVQSRSLS